MVQSLEEVLKNIPHEIIVVDDNSPDRTWEIAESLKNLYPSLRVIRRLSDRGLSSAVVAGMAAAAGDCFAVMDADLQHDETILPKMFEAVKNGNCDICIGSRTANGGSYGQWTGLRKLLSKAATILTKAVLPSPVSDPMSGYFVISRKLYIESAEKINPRGFKILLEFIGRNSGIKIQEIGYTFRIRKHGETKLSGSVIRNYLIGLYDIKFGKYISSQFAMYAFVGATGIFVNIAGFFLGEYMALPKINTGYLGNLEPLYLSVIFGIEISIISNYLLNNSITFYEIRIRGKNHFFGFTTFQLVSIFGLVIQTSVFLFLQNNGFFVIAGHEEIRKLLNNGLGITAATATNYFLNVNITWKSRR